MAFLSALLAGQAGAANQKVSNYQDAIAKAAEDKKEAQQQAQFDAEQQRLKADSAQQESDFLKNYDLSQHNDARAQAAADAITKSMRPPDPAHGDKYGGMQYRLEQQALDQGAANLTGTNLANAGRGLQNQASAIENAWTPVLNAATLLGKTLTNDSQRIANQYAPGMAQADLAGKNIANQNNRGDTVAHRDAQARRALLLKDQLDRSFYEWQGTVNSSNPADAQKSYFKAETEVDSATKSFLSAKTINPLGKPEMLADDKARATMATISQRINAAPDPFAVATQEIAALPDQPNYNAAKSYMMQIALATAQSVILRRKLTGQAPPAAAPQVPGGGAGLVSGAIFGTAPGGLGAMYGGSQGAPNPTRP